MHEPPERKTDRALLEAFRSGDAGALAVLYDRYASAVLAFALRFCDDRALAEDVVHDCFTELIDRIDGFELRGRLTTWFYVVAKRRALRLRDRARRAQGDLGPALNVPLRPEPELEDLGRLLARLPAGQREVVVLRFLDGFDLEAISEALDIPLGTVKSRLHHALASLRADPVCRRYFERSG
jgi:RNA polymerase sigma-70 factor (ECF subfamily)